MSSSQEPNTETALIFGGPSNSLVGSLASWAKDGIPKEPAALTRKLDYANHILTSWREAVVRWDGRCTPDDLQQLRGLLQQTHAASGFYVRHTDRVTHQAEAAPSINLRKALLGSSSTSPSSYSTALDRQRSQELAAIGPKFEQCFTDLDRIVLETAIKAGLTVTEETDALNLQHMNQLYPDMIYQVRKAIEEVSRAHRQDREGAVSLDPAAHLLASEDPRDRILGKGVQKLLGYNETVNKTDEQWEALETSGGSNYAGQ